MFGLQLRHIDEIKQKSDAKRVRFRMRHLIIFLTILSVVLGVGHIVVPKITVRADRFVFVPFLAAAAIVLTVPLLLGALIRRMSILGVLLLALLLTAGATALEASLQASLGWFTPTSTILFIAINVASTIFILVVAGIVRMNGYCLCATPASGKS